MNIPTWSGKNGVLDTLFLNRLTVVINLKIKIKETLSLAHMARDYLFTVQNKKKLYHTLTWLGIICL